MNGDFPYRGGWWVFGQSVLLMAASALGIVFHHHWSSELSVACGWLLVAVGAVLGIAGVLALGRNRTAFPRPLTTSTLVRHGIYGRVRHPLYGSLMHLAFGWALIRQSWPALAVALVLTVFLDAKARVEERWLEQKFPDYADYRKRVRRFVPMVY